MTLNKEHDLPVGVRSLYVRHERITSDGLAMSNEISGKLEFGKARGEIYHFAELNYLKKNVEVFWVPIPDSETGKDESESDPNDKFSTKPALSITAVSKMNGLTFV